MDEQQQQPQQQPELPYLAVDYELGEYDVVCGRGNGCTNHVGNQNLQSLIESMLDQYLAASKRRKMQIITEVVKRIQARSPHGGFVRQNLDNWRYYKVDDYIAALLYGKRDKVSQAFRDAIHSSDSDTKRRITWRSLKDSSLGSEAKSRDCRRRRLPGKPPMDSSLRYHESSALMRLVNLYESSSAGRVVELSRNDFEQGNDNSHDVRRRIVTPTTNRSMDVCDDERVFNILLQYSEMYQHHNTNFFEPNPLK